MTTQMEALQCAAEAIERTCKTSVGEHRYFEVVVAPDRVLVTTIFFKDSNAGSKSRHGAICPYYDTVAKYAKLCCYNRAAHHIK